MRNMLKYLSRPVISLFEGDGISPPAGQETPPTPPAGQETPPVVPATPPAAPAPAPLTPPTGGDPNAPVGGDPNARFDTEQVNRIVQDRLAKDRKKHEEKYKGLEATYQDLLANQSLSNEERTKLETAYEDLQKQHRTKEEQAKHEKKQLQEAHVNELKDWQERAVHWEGLHKTFVVEKSLIDAAVANDSFLPQQILDVLIQHTKLVEAKDEQGNPTKQLVAMVDLPDVDADTGNPIITQRTPHEAVERLKELQPNLFKSNVVSGVGGNSTTGGVTPGADGRIDQSQLTTAQWMETYKKDRTKLGLRPQKLK